MLRLWFLLILLSSTCWADGLTMRIFELANRPAEATVEMVRPLLSDRGTVLAESRLNKLIVKDTPAVLAEIEGLLKEIDQPAPHVRIQVSMNGIAQSNSRGAAVGLSGRGPRVGVNGEIRSSSGNTNSSSQQFLVVMSGERGVITMGRDLLNTSPYVQYAVASGFLPPGALFQQVSTGFSVQPIVVGKTVRMTITPWMNFVGPSGRQQVLFEESSTSVALESGSSMTIGSTGFRSREQSAAFGLIFGSAQRTSSSSGSIVLQPIIQDFYP